MKLTIIFGMLLALGRIWLGLNVEPDHFAWPQVYKDVAHLFMGGLFVAAWIKDHHWQWRLFWALNVVEVAVALGSRM